MKERALVSTQDRRCGENLYDEQRLPNAFYGCGNVRFPKQQALPCRPIATPLALLSLLCVILLT